jgi:glycosyltransferase involved in cell wall biosynthesis
MRHPQHVVWLMHQHRAAYELFDPREAAPALNDLREKIVAYDRRALSGVTRIFANSRRVAERLLRYNGLESTPLYHPPPGAELLRRGESWDYVFYPSRLESLKRQDLVIEAARTLATDTKILIGGEGPQRPRYERLIEKHALGQRVRLIGAFSEAERIALYAHALAVVFPPFDEDLGYVALEAMYAAKPVVTCRDSGGPLEFVVHGETGEVVDPSPQALADAIDRLARQANRARAMGEAGRERIMAMGLSWDRVVATLCA